MSQLGRTSLQIAAGLAAITVVGCGGGGSSSTPAPAPASTPVISTQPTAQTVVAGTNATFTLTATGDGTLSYQWRKDGANVAGGTSASLTIPAATAADAGIYECVVTNTKGSSTEIALSAGAALAVNTVPVILAQPTNQSAIASGSATFAVVASGNGTLSYQWQKDGANLAGATAASLSIPSVAAGNVGSYTCVVTNTLGSTTTTATTAAATLSLATSPVIASATGTQTLVEGANATFNVTASSSAGTLAYQWYKNGTALGNGGRVSGATSANLTLTGLVLADAANYSCVVTNTLNGVVTTGTSNAAGLVVVATPAITAQPATATFVQGQAGQMAVTASAANGTLSYQWAKDGTAIPGATAATYAVGTLAAADAGSYVCTVTNTLGGVTNSVATTAAVLTVNSPVTITSQPASVTQIEGGATSLSVVASAPTGTLSYQWKKNGVDINGATTSSLPFASLIPADAASYTCVITRTLNGTASTLTSAAAVLTVNTTPVITTAPVTGNIATGSTATFSVVATSTGTLSYQWYKTPAAGVRAPLAGATLASYTTPSVAIAALASYDGATYDCEITSTLDGTTTSVVTTTPVTLNVAALPTVTVTSTAGASPNGFNGTEAVPTLTANVTNAGSMNGTLSYQWKKGGVAIVGATSVTYTLPSVTAADAGSYTCTVVDTRNTATATATTSAMVVNVLAAPVITSDLPANNYKAGTANPTNSSLFVGATAPSGGTLSYQWQVSTDGGSTFGNVVGATTSSYAAPAYITGQARMYRCLVTNTVAATTSTVTSSASTVTLFQTAQITTQPVNTNVAGGAATSLSVTPTAIAVAPATVQTLQWYKGFSSTVAQPIPGATSATLSIAAADANDSGYYYCIVTNSLPGATVTSTATSGIVRLGVATAPTIVTQPAAAPIATEGTGFTLSTTATAALGNALTYQWKKGGTAIAGATGSSYTLSSPSAADVAAYTCDITSTVGALAPAAAISTTVTTTAANLTVNLKPTNLTPVVTGTGPITLTVTPTNPNGGGYLTYQWKRNGASLSGAVNASYTINEITATSAGNYTCDVSNVYVATSTSNGSTATATSPIAAVGVGTGVTTPVVTLGSAYTAGKTGIVISTAAQTGAAYEWKVDNGSITAGTGTNSITVTAGTNTSLPLTATVVVSNATGGAVGTASATVVAAVTTPRILAPAAVHPGDTWMKAAVENQVGTFAWGVTGAGLITGAAPTNALSLPFSANAGAVNGDIITLSANVQNAASDAAPTATKAVSVTTGTWLNKDGAPMWVLGTGSNWNGSASAALANGRVLVCGGQTLGQYTPATAAIYDPTTQRWTRIASMNVGRTGHTATALANGTILVTGGTSTTAASGTVYLNNAELYDPTTDTWTLLTSTNMVTGRMGHVATLMANGKVVITGGIASNATQDITSVIAVFSPTGSAGNFPGGTFSTSPVGLNLPRYKHTATALNDGRVLIAGGQGFTNETYQQAEIFDPTPSSTSAWTCVKVGSLTTAGRFYHTATLLLDGRVLLAGGSQSGNTAELFDPALGTFTATTGTLKGGYLATNTSGRNQHTATRLSDGRVLLAGGQGGSNQGVAQSAELFDPTTGTFSSTATPMNNGRYFHTAVSLPNGTVMMVGGTTPNLSNTNSAEVFDPLGNSGAGSWTTMGSMNGRGLTSAVRLADGRVMVIGGQSTWQGSDTTTTPSTDQTYSKTTQIYDPATGTWTAGGSLITARRSHTAVVLPNGKVLVAGGLGPQVVSFSNTVKVAELYDPATNTWTAVAPMNTARVFYGIVVLPDGKVLVAGGQDATGVSVATCEVYDPAANTWTTVGSMSEAKYYLSLTLLSSGKVAVAGGFTSDSSTGTAKVELYDPATQTWSTQVNSLAQARTQAFTFALPNGKLLLVGGRVQNPFIGNFAPVGAPTNGLAGAIEIYDTLANNGQGGTVPTTNPFFKTETRTLYTNGGAMLPNGKILLAGGTLNATTAASTSEIYDPATDTLTVGPALNTGQGNGCYSVTLANGDVMLIGGSQTDNFTQIYRP